MESSIIDIYELSPMQQGMLFHSLYEPNSGIYFEQRSCIIRGKLNLPAFRQAWQSVVDRHAILRTSFHWNELEKPLQVVHNQVELPWEELDWQGLGVEEQQVKLADFLECDRALGFDFQSPPLMRIAIIRLQKDSYQFVWSHHHLLMDGWCNGILLKEVFTLYKALCQGKDVFLPSSTPYRNYILWLQQQSQIQAEAHWRKELEGFTSPTPFGVDSLVPSNSNVVRKQHILDITITSALQNLARQNRITLNTIIQGVWGLLLSRYSGEKDIVFGTTVSGRPPELANVETIIGLFINTLPVRVQIDDYASIITWLKQLQIQQFEREQYSYSSLVEIHSWSDVERGVTLFESLLVFENYPTSIESILKAAKSDLQIQDTQGYDKTNYPLTLTVIPNDEILFKIDYAGNRFDEATIKRLFGHLEIMLRGIVANPTQQLWQLPAITHEEEELLASWNQTTQENSTNLCIHQLFEIQVEKTPDAVAVVFGEKQLTYRELNKKANQLANYLQKLGVKPEIRVGICVERSLEMIVGLLGILKAGGCYIPLDPVYPQERLTFMLKDNQTAVLLTQKQLLPKLHIQDNTQVICLDTDWKNIVQQSLENPISGVELENLAYVIYTSGSTGKPKGVMISHRAICNHMSWMQATFSLNETDKVLQKTPFSFDVSVWELYAPLLVGGQLIVAQPGGHQDTTYLIKVIVQQQVTLVQLVPSLLQALLEQKGIETCDSLKHIFCGGEVLPIALQESLLSKLNVNLHNLYGPTEACIDATLWTCKNGNAQQFVPIGSPINNTQIHILDANLQPVPIGVYGELHISGDGVARGYLNRPELTSEKFIPNPFSETPGTRLYKTGDRARYLSDGNIEYLGRFDNQVKIRGFRIELGEIETVLNQHQNIRSAIVVVFEDNNDKRLVAYLMTSKSIDLASLRQFLAKSLPSHMIPSQFIILDAIPITPNGKIDRRALPQPRSQTLINSNATAPRTPTQELLAGIWQSVLNLKSVGIEDNFFALGGHSLLVIRIISQIQQVFGVDIPLRQIFETPTIAELALQIDASTFPQLSSELIIPDSNRENLPLSFAQQRLWLLAQIEPHNPAYNVTAALQLNGKLNVDVLRQCFAEIIRRHQVLRTQFQTIDGCAVAVVTDVTVQIPVIDLSSIPAPKQQKQVEEITRFQSQQPFYLEKSPLLRVNLLSLNPNSYILLLSMHHIITDAWSVDILAQEIATLYQAFSQRKPSPLPDLAIQYADFAAWQRKQLESHKFDYQLKYWQQLQQSPQLLELPTDFPRPAVQTFRGKRHHFELTAELTQAIKKLSQEQHITLFMVMFSALSVLLHRYSQQDEIVIGSPIANRHYPGTDALIGFFANTLALRITFGDNPSVEELLPRVREIILAAHAHQDVPFEQVVEALRQMRSLSHSPLFQVMLVVENASTQPIELTGLRWTPLEMDSGTAKFDLTLMIAETDAGLQGKWEYNCDLFADATISKFTEHLQTLLTGITANPADKIGNLPLISDAELQKIINLGSPNQNYIYHQCIHQLFEEQVEKSGNAVAVICEDNSLTQYGSVKNKIPPTPLKKGGNTFLQVPLLKGDLGGSITGKPLTELYCSLTYAELNHKSNQLAHYLKCLGVKPEVAVGICVDSKLNFIVGILAILKAGGFYVPLDINYPQERLEFLIADAQVKVLLTQSDLAKLPFLQIPIFNFNTDLERIAHYPTTNPVNCTTLENLAYVMYTSGSTGIPKGVCVTHRGVVRLVKNCDYACLDDKEILLQAAPLVFDASTFEIWGALLNGSRLVILPPQKPIAEIANTITQHQITTLWLTAGLFHLMVDEHLDCFQKVKQLLAGGDVLSVTHIKKLAQAYPECRIINGYGPTENTTFTCCYPIPNTEELNNTISIGRPINNTQVYILDKYLNFLPIGIPGELYIAGDGLARGYLNQPELTAERFLPNPHNVTNVYQNEIYKTGDRVRYLDDGNIEYLGRFDNQVKIRGFRIELGEIEAVLNQHPHVQDCVVVASVTKSQQKQLVAYFVPLIEPENLTSQLRQFLQQQLPDYLIPNLLIPLEALPLTANGKVDKKALPTPELPTQQDVTLPITEIEAILVKIWSSLLNVSLGIHDNFFALGGDSILAIQVISRANQAGLQLTPKQLFQHQTIAELAAVVTPISQSVAQQGIVTGIVPLTPIQHWFFEQKLTNQHHFNQAVLLRVQDKLQPAILSAALKKLLQHHDVLRSRYTKSPQWQAEIIEFNDNIPLINCDLSNLLLIQQATALSTISTQLQASLDISNGTLLRVAHFDLGTESRLLIIIHHLVIDGVSWRILLEDLQTVYQQLLRGEVVKLPLKTTSFPTWVEKLQKLATSATIQQQLDYWLSNNYQQIQPLPVDYPDGSNIVADAVPITVSLSQQETQALLKEVPPIYNTQINDVLLTACTQVISTWTGNELVLINLETYGRNLPEEIDVSRTVGWFTAIYPLILKSKNGENWGDALKDIKEQLRTVPEQGIGYGLLRYLSNNEEIRQRLLFLPSPEITFNYLGQLDVDFANDFSLCPDFSVGTTQNIQQIRRDRIEINGFIKAGKLQFEWIYSRKQYQKSTIKNLADNFHYSLQLIITHCQSLDAGGYTPSDFELAGVNQDTLDLVLGMVNFETEDKS